MENADSNVLKGIVVGALAGALLGAAVGWAYASAAGEDGRKTGLTPGDYFKLGIALLGVARQVGEVAQRV